MKSLCLALQFLTLIRLPWKFDYTKEDFVHSLRWFFLPGLIIGVLQYFFAQISFHFQISTELSAILIVIIGIIATGGLHLDGVADVADGFGAGTDRESILRIMKDDRLGVFGVCGIVLVLFLKIASTRFLLQTHSSNVLFFAPAISRSLLSATCSLVPYARSEGTGKSFSEGRFLIDSLPSLLFVALWMLLISREAWIPIVLTVTSGALFCIYCFLKIRGYTGDTLGFQNELTEIVFLIASR